MEALLDTVVDDREDDQVLRGLFKIGNLVNLQKMTADHVEHDKTCRYIRKCNVGPQEYLGPLTNEYRVLSNLTMVLQNGRYFNGPVKLRDAYYAAVSIPAVYVGMVSTVTTFVERRGDFCFIHTDLISGNNCSTCGTTVYVMKDGNMMAVGEDQEGFMGDAYFDAFDSNDSDIKCFDRFAAMDDAFMLRDSFPMVQSPLPLEETIFELLDSRFLFKNRYEHTALCACLHRQYTRAKRRAIDVHHVVVQNSFSDGSSVYDSIDAINDVAEHGKKAQGPTATHNDVKRYDVYKRFCKRIIDSVCETEEIGLLQVDVLDAEHGISVVRTKLKSFWVPVDGIDDSDHFYIVKGNTFARAPDHKIAYPQGGDAWMVDRTKVYRGDFLTAFDKACARLDYVARYG